MLTTAFADSLVVVLLKIIPVQLYSYAQSILHLKENSFTRNTNPMVKAVVQLSQTPNALFYFPFLDDILSGKNIDGKY